MSNKEQKGKDQKGLQRLILDTARELLIATGYARLSMRNIANKIGYSATSIYLYYENKDDLVHALIDEGVDLLFEQMNDADSSASEAAARLRAMCNVYITFGLNRPQYYEIMYVLHPEYIKRYPAEKYRKARRILELIAGTMRETTEKGVLSEKESMLCANLAWAQLHGVVTLLSSERVDKRIEPQVLIDGVCDQIVANLKATSMAITSGV